MTDKHEQFKQTLDNTHTWPCPYIYKFIVPTENLFQLTELFPDEKIEIRESKTGKYSSVTMTSTMCSSKEVMEVYTKASQVPGIMSL
ncbi:MAG: DUF493 family protein [Pseudodesulfovibrio sp.]|nr:DUF493 family protein [Pseudodesulfovibrio sp.]